MTAYWYVMRSKPNKEQFLWEQLTARQWETYCPQMRAQPVNPRARKSKPYFPGYLFIRVDLDKTPASELQWTPGAIGFVSFGGSPTPVSDELVRAIRKRVEETNAAGGETLAALKRGDKVTIESGVFAGYEAIFDSKVSGNERARVLLEMVQGNITRAEIRVGLLRRKEKRK